MKIVLDTNLLIDGSADDNNFGNRIIDAVLDGKVSTYTNRQTLAENRLLARRKISDTAYLEKLNKFFDEVNLVETSSHVQVVEDPEDNKILESAVDSGAEFLVTSDHHLLKLEEYDGVKIVTPSGFWQEFEEERNLGWANWLRDFIK
ncbi:MAG TPA: putative toxin-antitoxin system toxin component, PIN family [Patescibacteria group bacterium]|nr:putative toxin-antitoxin system toxin component, PIN family [Patescibacteria group bacterium]